MRLLMIGALEGYMTEAGKIAMTKGAQVSHVYTIEQALERLRQGRGADLAMIDVVLDVGLFMRSIDQEHINLPVVACGVGTKPQATAAIRAGAKEYLPLPPDPELIAAILEAVTHEPEDFIAQDPIMLKSLDMAKQVARSDASVLITGESGTGKEVMAAYIHKHSKRHDKVFVSLNSAAIPENLLESELFGHEKGAFTGAVARRIGKFEEAHGGTILLDEISEMHPHLQAKLLRAIQEKSIDRVGGQQPVKVDIRIIATSNRDLLEAVREGAFREDLFFRLNVVNIHLPPLRDRPQDIVLLANYFREKYSKVNEIETHTFDTSAQQALMHYPWRGNVRELENVIHRAVLLSQGPDLKFDEILSNMSAGPQSHGLKDNLGSDAAKNSAQLIGSTIHSVERNLILDTLEHCLGNRTHAANILGISIRTLRNKLKQYGDEGEAVTPPFEFEQAMKVRERG